MATPRWIVPPRYVSDHPPTTLSDKTLHPKTRAHAREVHELAVELDALRFTPDVIGRLLGYTGHHIRKVLEAEGRRLRRRSESIDEALATLTPALRDRCVALRQSRVEKGCGT